MSIERELGEINAELSGVKEAQVRIREDLKDGLALIRQEIKEGLQALPCTGHSTDINSKVNWRQMMAILGILMGIGATTIGATYATASKANERSLVNETKIEQHFKGDLENVASDFRISGRSDRAGH